MRRTFPLCAALLLLCASMTFADDVRLKNGDRYSGTVDSLAAGTLTFKTPHGDLAIPWADVAGLTVADAIVVTGIDGTEPAVPVPNRTALFVPPVPVRCTPFMLPGVGAIRVVPATAPDAEAASNTVSHFLLPLDVESRTWS